MCLGKANGPYSLPVVCYKRVMHRDFPVLQQSRWLRFLTLAVLYAAQGLPVGLFQVAIPAWFAAEGLSLGQIGGFIAIVFLPWSFKLFAGPVMDKFSFPPMGRRRPWVLGAQSGINALVSGWVGGKKEKFVVMLGCFGR